MSGNWKGLLPQYRGNANRYVPAEALALLEQNKYHAAFVDLHMPGMNGYELSAAMHERYPYVDIVIFTADIMSGVKVRLAKMGIHTILNKPFVPGEMLRIHLKIMHEKRI